MKANVTVMVGPCPVNMAPPVRTKDRKAYVVGDGKVLATVHPEPGHVWAALYLRACAIAGGIPGATSIRHGLGTYSVRGAPMPGDAWKRPR